MAWMASRTRLALIGWAATAVAGVVLGLAAVGWMAGDWSVDLPWAPSLGMRIEFALDGLAALYALLAAGIGLLVFIYATAYLPRHLEHQGRPPRDGRGFWSWMVVFLVSMVGLAASQDLVLMFVFFDVTAIASYFLIGFDRRRTEARGAALMAVRSGAPLFFGAPIRREEHYLAITEEINTPRTGELSEVVHRLTADYTACLESLVRQWPEQYFWHHRRWKTRPPGGTK